MHCSFGVLVKRIARFPDKSDYLADLEAKSDLSDRRDEILDRVSAVIVDVLEYRNSYENYAYLWVDDRQVGMVACYEHLTLAQQGFLFGLTEL